MSTVLISGKARWAKIRDAVPGYKAKPEDPLEWSIDVIPNATSWADFDKTGIQLKKRTADDGAQFVTIKRKTFEFNYKDDENQDNKPPEVYLKDEQTGEYNKWPVGNIGNGSDVTVAVEYYTTRVGVGSRLARIFVDNLIPYDGPATGEAPDTAKLPF